MGLLAQLAASLSAVGFKFRNAGRKAVMRLGFISWPKAHGLKVGLQLEISLYPTLALLLTPFPLFLSKEKKLLPFTLSFPSGPETHGLKVGAQL